MTNFDNQFLAQMFDRENKISPHYVLEVEKYVENGDGIVVFSKVMPDEQLVWLEIPKEKIDSLSRKKWFDCFEFDVWHTTKNNIDGDFVFFD